MLIEAGHRWEDIQQYPMPRFSTFLKLYSNRKKRGYTELAMVVRSAYHAEPKSFKEFLKSMDED